MDPARLPRTPGEGGSAPWAIVQATPIIDPRATPSNARAEHLKHTYNKLHTSLRRRVGARRRMVRKHFRVFFLEARFFFFWCASTSCNKRRKHET